MKYKLIAPVNPSYSAIEQVLTNRGIPYNEINHYLNTTDEDINSYNGFGEDNLKHAAAALIRCIQLDQKALVIVDCDCDGYTSAAVLINYLHDYFPNWVESKLDFVMHEGKQHGLNDQMDLLIGSDYQLLLVPDAGSNDVNECSYLVKDQDMDVIILDHHICDVENPRAILINNQASDYPNKALSGVGVVWQFCRYLDTLLGGNAAAQYIDLVALGLDGDMMSMTSIETKHLIQKGLAAVTNPFIYYMHERNKFSLGETLTPIGVTFYIVPFVNAITRSGTLEEKELVFSSMLKHRAFQEVPSTKRGHAQGETEKIVEQAIRVAHNVKARQTRVQDAAMEFLDRQIMANNMLDHEVLLFLLNPGQVDRNIAGLVANKIMAKYQRPTCVLTRVIDEERIVSYQGSARGCDKVGINEFKSICDATGIPMYTAGHEGAFGIGLLESDIEAFLIKTDEILKDTPNEPLYYVDYIYRSEDINPQNILDIANMSNLWGKDIDEAIVAVEGLRIFPEMVTIYSKKNLTIKISLPNGITIMKFNATEEECELFQTNNTGFVEINLVGKCNANEWMGNITAQLFCEEYEVVDSNKYFF